MACEERDRRARRLVIFEHSLADPTLTDEDRESAQDIDIERFTCFTCSIWRECGYSFDDYNTDGDCLAWK